LIDTETLSQCSDVDFISLSVIPQDSNTTVLLETTALVSVNNPLGTSSPITILNTTMEAELIYNNKTIGYFSTPTLPVKNGSSTVIEIYIKSEMTLADGGAQFEVTTD